MGIHAPPRREELKDRYFTVACPVCEAVNHVLVTYDPKCNHDIERGLCWSCGALVHEEDCFLIWTGNSKATVERYAEQAARLRRAL